MTRLDHAAPARGKWMLAAMVGLAVVACGEPVSLDEARPSAAETSGTAGSASSSGSGSGGSTHAAEADSGFDDPEPDLPGDSPAGVCGSGCEVRLERGWAWRSEAPDGHRSEWEPHAFSALASRVDGLFFVGEQRGDEAWVSSIDLDGSLLWSEPLSLFCNCEIIDLATSPWGDVVFTAQARSGEADPRMVIGRFEVWSALAPWFNFPSYTNYPNDTVRVPQIGSVIPLNGFFGGIGGTATVAIIPDQDESPPVQENVALYVFDGFSGFIDAGSTIDSQPVTHSRRPLGVEVGDETVAVAYEAAEGSGEDAYAVWVQQGSWSPFEAQPLPGIPDDLAESRSSRLVVLSHRVREPGQLELHLELRAPDVPPAWHTVRVLDTELVAAPQLVAASSFGTLDGVAVVVPLLRERDGELERAVEVLAFDAEDGSMIWRETLPLRAESAVGVAAQEDGSLVLATTVGGRVVVQRWEVGCACDEGGGVQR